MTSKKSNKKIKQNSLIILEFRKYDTLSILNTPKKRLEQTC